MDAAIRHLKDSAAQGNQFAQYTLGKLYLLGHEVKADHEEALRYLSQAAAQGNTYAQYFIDHQNDFNGASVGNTVLRMLHQMSRIFREHRSARHLCWNADRQETPPQITGEAHGNGTQSG